MMKVCGKRDVYLPPCEDSCEIGTLNVGSNGTYDAESAGYDGYGEVRVNVPNSYTYADNGKVVQNGALVSQSSREISDNGEYDTTTNNRVLVNVAEGDTVEYTPIQTSGDELGTITINGESQTIYGVDYSSKQDALVSGANIKTINNTSLLGSGNINIAPDASNNVKYDDTVSNVVELYTDGGFADTFYNVAGAQAKLVSGTNIKTINNQSILGSGNITISGGGGATNWLNGSATGSVRTIGSWAEDSSYTMGADAVAEGNGTEASGDYSHAEGHDSQAIGESSHAEGANALADGAGAHAEGADTAASGVTAHAEGSETVASGDSSHAGGVGTTAQRASQQVFGEYNILDTGGSDETTRGDYVEIVGNGTAWDSLSNARTLDWDGNEELAGALLTNGDIIDMGLLSVVDDAAFRADVDVGGTLTVAADPSTNMEVATKQYVDTKSPSTTSVTITVANWNATTTCTKSVTGVTTSNTVIVSPAPASMTDYISSGVYCSAQGSGTLTFTASSTPTANITVNVMIVG